LAQLFVNETLLDDFERRQINRRNQPLRQVTPDEVRGCVESREQLFEEAAVWVGEFVNRLSAMTAD
jgi:hypothetical protein